MLHCIFKLKSTSAMCCPQTLVFYIQELSTYGTRILFGSAQTGIPHVICTNEEWMMYTFPYSGFLNKSPQKPGSLNICLERIIFFKQKFSTEGYSKQHGVHKEDFRDKVKQVSLSGRFQRQSKMDSNTSKEKKKMLKRLSLQMPSTSLQCYLLIQPKTSITHFGWGGR